MAEPKIYIVETEYCINYTTKNPVPIPEIIDTLVSIERYIHKTPAFIEKAYKGIKIVDVEVYVDSLQAGSLKENFIVKFFIKEEGDRENLEKMVEKILRENDMVKTLVAVGVGGFLGWGALAAMSPGTPAKHIEAYNNTIVNIGGEVNLSGDDVAAIIKAASNKKQIVQDAIKIIKPAKNDPDSTIEIAGMQSLTIDKDFIRETPKEYTPPVPDEKEETYSNADIVIFASDRDHSDSHWAGIVPGIVDTRTNFILAEDVDPKQLHGRLRAKADITVTSKFNKKKKSYVPKSVEIRVVN